MDKTKYVLLAFGGFVILSIIGVLIFINTEKKKESPLPIEEVYAHFEDSLVELKIGDTYELKISISDEKDHDFTFQYSSSNEKVAIVDDNGIVKALNYGNAVITAKYGNDEETNLEIFIPEEIVQVVKPEISVQKVSIVENSITLSSSEKYQLKTVVLPENATNKKLTFETNDSRIAEVTDEGLVIGKVQGKTLINVYSNNEKTDIVEVSVSAPKVTLDTIEVMPNNITLVLGDSYQLKAVLTPSNVTDSKITWSSTDNSIVEVSNGQIKAKKAGTATITATSSSKKATVKVTVVQKTVATINVLSVTFNKNNIILNSGQVEQITPTISPSNATNKSLIWTSSNSSVATVTSSGKVLGVSKGTATITAKSVNNMSATLTVTVNEDSSSSGGGDGNTSGGTTTTVPKEIILSSASFTLQKKATKQLRATILPLTASQKVTWTSSNESVASVSSNGLVTAKQIGDATIAAITSNGLVAKATVAVRAKPLGKPSNYGNGNIPDSTIAIINEHLNDYLEEAVYFARKSGKSERRAKAVAAAYFLIYNPYYKVPYGYGRLSKYRIRGWNPVWSNTVGVECSGFVTWSLIQAGLPTNMEVQDYSARIAQTDANTYWKVDYILSLPIQVGDVLNKRYPRDSSGNKLGNGHWAIIVDINKAACTLTVAHATSVKAGLHLSTYKCGTTINYNRVFNTDKY